MNSETAHKAVTQSKQRHDPPVDAAVQSPCESPTQGDSKGVSKALISNTVCIQYIRIHSYMHVIIIQNMHY